MFTGIITAIGEIVDIARRPGADLHAVIRSTAQLADVELGASIACSGVCLTVTHVDGDRFAVDISAETLARTASHLWQPGARLNLERALKVGDELGGHIVTGHVDGIGEIVRATPADGSLELVIAAPRALAASIAAKGSVAVDGVSLTVNSVADQPDGSVQFHLNIIPHTAACTTLADAAPGREVNLEIDVLARYLARMLDVRQQQ